MEKIEIIHLAKDNEIDTMECSICGASLKHAMVINGRIHGLDCGAKVMGWNTTTNKQTENKATRRNNIAANFKKFYYGKRIGNFLAVFANRANEEFELNLSEKDPQYYEKIAAAVA